MKFEELNSISQSKAYLDGLLDDSITGKTLGFSEEKGILLNFLEHYFIAQEIQEQGKYWSQLKSIPWIISNVTNIFLQIEAYYSSFSNPGFNQNDRRSQIISMINQTLSSDQFERVLSIILNHKDTSKQAKKELEQVIKDANKTRESLESETLNTRNVISEKIVTYTDTILMEKAKEKINIAEGFRVKRGLLLSIIITGLSIIIGVFFFIKDKPSITTEISILFGTVIILSYIGVHFFTKNYYFYTNLAEGYQFKDLILKVYPDLLNTANPNERSSIIDEMTKRLFEPINSSSSNDSDFVTPVTEILKNLKK